MSGFKPDALGKPLTGLRLQLYTIIFQADTCAWRWSDQVIIVRILRLLRVFKMTTVDFGDTAPKTDLGRLIGSRMMPLGWGTLAVPTGIVTSELTAQRYQPAATTTRTCQECLTDGQLPEANFCRHCGARLSSYAHDQPAR